MSIQCNIYTSLTEDILHSKLYVSQLIPHLFDKDLCSIRPHIPELHRTKRLPQVAVHCPSVRVPICRLLRAPGDEAGAGRALVLGGQGHHLFTNTGFLTYHLGLSLLPQGYLTSRPGVEKWLY